MWKQVEHAATATNDSMTILDQPGAGNLLGRGDMLFLSADRIERLQGFYITPDELETFLAQCLHRGKTR